MARKKIEVEIGVDDKITRDLERIEGEVKELDAMTAEIAVDADTDAATRKMEDLGRTTNKTGGVMANFAGNASQDLGQLAGVTGSAGVALGQFAEYATEGDIALKGLAVTAGGMAGVAAAIEQITAQMAVLAEADAFDTEQVEAFKDALLEGKTAVEALKAELTEAGKVTVRDFGESALAALPWGDDTVMRDITDKVVSLGIDVDEFSDIAADNTKDLKAWAEAMIADGQNAEDVLDVYSALLQARGKLALGTRAAAISQQFFNTTVDKGTTIVDKYNDSFKTTSEMHLEHQAGLLGVVAAQEDFDRAVVDSELSLRDLADTIDSIEEDALNKLFETGNEPIDTLTKAQKLHQEMRDFVEWFNKQPGGLPNLFDPNDVNADDFLDKIGKLRGPIQENVAAVFAESGPAAAQAIAKGFVDSLAKATGLTSAEITTLLGLDDLEAKIRVSIEMSEVELAKQQLAILEGLFGGDATRAQKTLIANLKLALEAGSITGEQAQTVIQNELRDFGVVIPTKLGAPDTHQAILNAQDALNANPLTIPVVLATSTSAGEAARLGAYAIPNPQPTINQTIIYPPGTTPTATVGAGNIYLSRNGSRTSP